jgi:biopolymer transport protein ExbB/TolQ
MSCLDDIPDTSSATKSPMLLTLGAGLVVSGFFYVLLIPVMQTGFGQLFYARGWVPPVLVILMSWSYAILMLKYFKFGKQQAVFNHDPLPMALSEDIPDGAVPFFREHIAKLPVKVHGNFLLTRILRGLSHFQARNSTAETATMLASQSEIDATHVESSYAVVKVFIWAIPILGFIGTVMGISEAVSGFSGDLQNTQDISVIKDKLGLVSSGLGVAFDTTLIALIMSLLVMFPATVMQMMEENLLNRIDDFCNEKLVKRLDEGSRSRMGDGELHQDIATAVQCSIAGNDAALIHRLEDLQKAMVQLQENQAALIDGVSNTMLGAAESLSGSFATIEEGVQSLGEVVRHLQSDKIVVEAHYHEKAGLFKRRKKAKRRDVS